ncbi:gamma-glutamyltransferase family protein [Microseira wollei]|uniref:Gamma-glutamyltransferase n=1 Tax=Microseira wollei NIES-4236 TaxID=2530354 RepID=A0AAV3X7A8_9CYAN|nr:gamma-glutamyltransferase family protein [Microseira wollei]GET37206.1 gamma-glutamyltransferase [Microseira wollei NIES-4236]
MNINKEQLKLKQWRIFDRSTGLSLLLLHLCFSISLLWPHKPASAAFIQPQRSKKGMVVSAHPLASEAGLAILKKGGNAVDAAVATAFAISVVEPFSAGIGGGGFLLLHLAQTGEMKALDFRERAPLRATRDMYLDSQGKVRPNASVNGYLAVAVPGTVAGLAEVHRRYGKLPWREVVAPAIRLADEGFIVSPVRTWRFSQISETRTNIILNNPAARQIFAPNGVLFGLGDRLIQRDLAMTLRAIAQNPQSFYTGNIARTIAEDMARNGGLITLEDLKSYQPTWREPLCGTFRVYQICSMPPPSSGGVLLLEMLNIIGDTDIKSKGWNHPDTLHFLAENMKIAYADRSVHLGDPDFVDVPVAALTSRAYAAKRRQEISMQRARPASEIKPISRDILQRFVSFIDMSWDRAGRMPTPQDPSSMIVGQASCIVGQASCIVGQASCIVGQASCIVGWASCIVGWASCPSLMSRESPDTSHLTVVDEQRNTVSLTFTINTGFGAGVVVPGTGILLNNEMDDFAIAPGVPNLFGLVGGDANAIAPRKIPLSSMSPTIVTENNRLRLATGSPGGSTIITTVLQIILNVLVYDMDAGAAVSASRIHHQWSPDKLRVEPFGLDALTLAELRRRGHQIEQQNPWGNANAISQTSDGWLEGAADPRGEGAAKGF